MTRIQGLPRGGVIPPDNDLVPRASPIVNAALPSVAVIPLLQHQGAPAQCLVKTGDRVREGMLIGRADGPHSANVHSSIPGLVVDIRTIPLPDGARSAAVVIELGGEFDRSGRPVTARPWEGRAAVDLLGAIQAAGVVGLGGGLVPTHLKLAAAPGTGIDLVIANGVDSEPSLGGDYALMRDRPGDIVEALRICASILGARGIAVAIGEHAEDLVPRFEQVLRERGTACDILVLPSRYPQGNEQLVLSAVEGAGRAAPGQGRRILNVATLCAIHDAVVLGKPLVDRVLTVTGSAVRAPRHLRVRMGTNVAELFEECGGFSRPPARIVIGGPMRGHAVDSADVPVTKGTTGVMALSRSEARSRPQWPCIRCGSCVEACPWELVPMQLYKLIEQGDAARARREGLDRCTECGCCAFACPSNIPLVVSLRAGKAAAGLEPREVPHG
jgi:Na+-translocating ferredoxin:NAD+ oxidoreductase subunit C